MSIETTLLLVESFLLLTTVILLLYSLKEGRQRSKLIVEVGKATRTLTRMEYFLAVHDAMTDAKKEVIGCITGRRPGGDDAKRVMDIVATIKKMTAAGVRVKYLLPKFQDRLYIGHLYASAGAEVRYAACSMVHNLRYIVVDGRMVVIGIPESVGEREATKKGFRIPSEALAAIMESHFCGCWQEDVTFEGYLREALGQTGVSAEQLARELNLDARELEKILSKPLAEGRPQKRAACDIEPKGQD